MLLSTALVSLDAQGTGAAHGKTATSAPRLLTAPLPTPSQSPQGNLSADGTHLVFTSDATDLVGSLADTDGASNVYVTTTFPAWYVDINNDAPSSPRIGAQFRVYSCSTVRGSVSVAPPPWAMAPIGCPMAIRAPSLVSVTAS